MDAEAPIQLLHVDDDEEFAELTAMYLARFEDRIAVETAGDVDEGLEALATGAFDCVVSDYDMPGRNGIEFLEAVRVDRPDLPFILFTGKGSEDVASDAISAGVTDYLQKGGGPDLFELLANRIVNAVDRRRAEREADLWAKAVEASNEGIAIIDGDGRYTKMNDAYAGLYGVEPATLIGEPWVTTVPEEEVERLQADVIPTLSDGPWSDESIGQRVDDSVYPKVLSLAALDDGGHVCVIRDISDRKEREAELESNAAELEAKAAKLDILFEQSPDLIDIHDADGRIVDANSRLCDELGYDRAELLGKRVWDVDESVDPAEVKRVWGAMEPGEMRELRGRYRRRDGSTLPVVVHVARTDLHETDQFFVIARESAEEC
ncbi:PAS domain S-box protein [Halorubrum yunnanense]|uniref:PAS domain S-box protein n=1 Tax=Halorubrum yunnanense TaxID=1526162 RepID=A0ABD5YFT8_9EURY|nr:PAS domain S-box protein [Halorubrum yunnanense]